MTPEEERIAWLRGHMDSVIETTTTDGTAEVLRRIYIKDMTEALEGWQAAVQARLQAEEALRIEGEFRNSDNDTAQLLYTCQREELEQAKAEVKRLREALTEMQDTAEPNTILATVDGIRILLHAPLVPTAVGCDATLHTPDGPVAVHKGDKIAVDEKTGKVVVTPPETPAIKDTFVSPSTEGDFICASCGESVLRVTKDSGVTVQVPVICPHCKGPSAKSNGDVLSMEFRNVPAPKKEVGEE